MRKIRSNRCMKLRYRPARMHVNGRCALHQVHALNMKKNIFINNGKKITTTNGKQRQSLSLQK